MINTDQVSVICIAYNHEKWIEKALESVAQQDHSYKELIIVDNGSADHTLVNIRNWVARYSGKLPIAVIAKPISVPYCALFNEVLKQATGEFIVDLSGDDFLYPQHLSLSVARLRQVPVAAFVFSNATLSEENGDQEMYYQDNDISTFKDQVLGREFYEVLIRKSF
ncbi:MAG: glycosyltransferase family A protein, partial [Algoriphagus sp.]